MRTALTLSSIVTLVACSAAPVPAPTVTGTAALSRVAALPLDGHVARSIAVRDSIAAIGCGPDGLYLVDVSRPAEPTVLAHVESLDASSVVFGSDALIVAGDVGSLGSPTLRSVDVLDPRAPVLGETFAVVFRPDAGLTAEGGLIAATRGKDGPLVTDERRLEFARARSFVHAGTDDATLLRRGFLFVHARYSPWFSDSTHRILIANADRGESEVEFALPGEPGPRGALGLVGDDLLCARAEAIDVVTSATTSAARVGLPLAVAGVTRIGVDGARAALLATGGSRLVLVERDVAGQLAATALFELDTPALDVALAGSHALVACGTAGLVVVRVERGGAP